MARTELERQVSDGENGERVGTKQDLTRAQLAKSGDQHGASREFWYMWKIRIRQVTLWKLTDTLRAGPLCQGNEILAHGRTAPCVAAWPAAGESRVHCRLVCLRTGCLPGGKRETDGGRVGMHERGTK